MNQFRRVGWMTMWAATMLAFVLSFHEPAATYAMALRPASDTRNYLGLPWPVPEARKWTLVVAGVAFVAVIREGLQPVRESLRLLHRGDRGREVAPP